MADPIPAPPGTAAPVVTINGEPAPVSRISTRSDSPTSFTIPPRQGHIAGWEADIDWEYPHDASTQLVQPWSGQGVRAVPESEVDIQLPAPDGTLYPAGRGVIDSTRISLGAPSSRVVDPLADVEAEFSCPPYTRVYPIEGGSAGTPSDRRIVGSQGVFQVERAMNALGVRNMVPQSTNCVAHHTFCGSLLPVVGDLAVAGRADGIGPEPVPSPIGNYTPTFESSEDGRVVCLSGWVITRLARFTGPTTASLHIALELHPDYPSAAYQARVTGTGEAGLQVRVNGNTVYIRTINGDGLVQETLGSFTRGAAKRLLVRSDPRSGDVTAMLDTDATKRTYAGKAPAALSAAHGGRFIVGGSGFGSMSVYRGRPDVDNDSYMNQPRRAAFHISPVQGEQWKVHSAPAIINEKASAWLSDRAQKEQSHLWTDHQGVTHWFETRGMDDLPVTGVITDARVDAGSAKLILDGLAHRMTRKSHYSRVEATGTRGVNSYSYAARPNREAARAPRRVELTPDSDPVTIWCEPEGDGWWYGDVSTEMRWAGEPATKSWHRPDDFAKLRGSWCGGRVEMADGESRWAVPGDVTYTAEQVGYNRVKVTITPDSGLPDGSTFVNLPYADSAGLAATPDVLDKYLPVFTAWGVSPEVVTEVGTSTAIGPSDRPVYEHDGGWVAAFQTGTRTPEDLAQDIADRHINHVGEVTITCEAADVRIGERYRVELAESAGISLDVFVLGVPRTTVSATQATMEIRAWCLSVRGMGGAEYAAGYAGLAYAGLSYAGL